MQPTKTDVKKDTKLHKAELKRLTDLFDDEDEEFDANIKAYQEELAAQAFPNGGNLRDYQAEGVTWLASNFIYDRSSILCDEMGLGKTLQVRLLWELSLLASGVVVTSCRCLWRRDFGSRHSTVDLYSNKLFLVCYKDGCLHQLVEQEIAYSWSFSDCCSALNHSSLATRVYDLDGLEYYCLSRLGER